VLAAVASRMMEDDNFMIVVVLEECCCCRYSVVVWLLLQLRDVKNYEESGERHLVRSVVSVVIVEVPSTTN
jgi:hypothetical protein